MSDCNLADISTAGHQVTWIKSRGTVHVVEEHLDQALTTTDWMELFPNVKIVNLIASHSDHISILLHYEPSQEKECKFEFIFQKYWLKEEGIKSVV